MFRKQAEAYKYGEHFMLDMETLGLKRKTVITQVAIVRYTPVDGEIKYHSNIVVNFAIGPQIVMGRSIDLEALDFWYGQPVDIRKGVLGNVGLLWDEAMLKIHEFLIPDPSNGNKPRYIWANGAVDDHRWLEGMYEDWSAPAGIILDGQRSGVPFRYNQFPCFRTLIFGCQEYVRRAHKNLATHDALADALWQGKVLIDFINNYDNVMKQIDNPAPVAPVSEIPLAGISTCVLGGVESVIKVA